MKKRLTVMPEVLPTPTVMTTGSVRERTLARLRVLATFGAATIAPGCGDSAYGVVDPLPAPQCFDTTFPDVTAHFSTVDELGGVSPASPDGGTNRLVTLDLTFDDPKFSVTSFTSNDPFALVLSTVNEDGKTRVIVRVTGDRSVVFSGNGTCTEHSNGYFRVSVTVSSQSVTASSQ